VKNKVLPKSGKCIAMGIITTRAQGNLSDAASLLDEGYTVPSHMSITMAANQLKHMRLADGRLRKEASKIERDLRRLLGSFHAEKRHLVVDDKEKVKKGIVGAIVQVGRLGDAASEACGLPKELSQTWY